MKKVFIDEYLSVQLRQQIDKLVGLNLDLESILSLLSNDLYGYADYMLDEIKRYVKYVLWLREHHKDRNLAFEKYKKQTKKIQKTKEILPSNSSKDDDQNHLANELFLTQLYKERKRIDEISSLHYAKKLEENVEQEVDEDLKKIKLEDNPVDEILEGLSDEEIQETLSEILTNDFDSLPFDLNNSGLIQTNNLGEDGDGPNDQKEPKNEQPILDEPTGDQNPKSLTEETKKLEDLTFDDILTDHSTTLLNSNANQTLFDFDYLEDNGTETLNDSILLENDELNLQSFTTEQFNPNQSDQTDSEVQKLEEINDEETKSNQLAEPINVEDEKIKDEEIDQVTKDEILESSLDQIDEETGEEETNFDQLDEEISDESEEFDTSDETNKALDFLNQLEEKYGDQTLSTLDTEKHDFQTTNFTLAEPTSTLKIGVHVHYQNNDYVVESIEIEVDFFHHQQTIVTLIDPETENKIQINAKKIK